MGTRAGRLSRPLGPWAPSWGGSCRWDGWGLRSQVRGGHCPRMDILSSLPPWRRGSELGDPRLGPVSSKGGGRWGQDAGWEGGCGSFAGRPSLPSPASPPTFPSFFSPSPFLTIAPVFPCRRSVEIQFWYLLMNESALAVLAIHHRSS